jgi:hypothetical protein
MKIVFTVPPRSCAAGVLAVLTAATAQFPQVHGPVGNAMMVMAGIAYGRLINSGPGTPTS